MDLLFAPCFKKKYRGFTPVRNKFLERFKFPLPLKGFTLIEVLVAFFLILVIFLGIFEGYEMALKVIGLSKNKISATAIANQQLEKIRNLSYESVGTKDGFPSGVLDAAKTVAMNDMEYRVETRVDYVVDQTDGIAAPDDECPNDYKKAEVKVSWQGKFPGEIALITDIAPKNIAQECAEIGGILSVFVFDAYGQMVASPLIEIKDPTNDQVIKTATPSEGKYYFSLPLSSYKVIVSKSGYSSEQTYSTQEIVTPEKPNPIVLDGQLTEISFSIDKISVFSVDTLSSWGTDNFSDSFLDENKISENSNLVVTQGEVKLATSLEGYLSSGYLFSIEIAPADLSGWDKFSFSDLEPENTDLKYQIYYFSGTDWELVPDSDLPGNSTGFDTSPVDLSNLLVSIYSGLKLRGNFSTDSAEITPLLYDWQVSWITDFPTAIPNAAFKLQGAKIIGTDAGENPIYKYSENTISNSSGHVNINGLEWDSYTFSVNSATGLDLISTDPPSQPIGLSPDSTLPVKLYLDAQNSLLMTIQNIETTEPIFFATVRLFNSGLGCDITQYTDEKGKTYFIPLESAVYNLEVQAPGYSSSQTTISVFGDKTAIIKLEQIE